MSSGYPYTDGQTLTVTADMRESFDRDGYITIRCVLKQPCLQLANYQQSFCMTRLAVLKYSVFISLHRCRGLLTERELIRLRSDLERDDGIVQHAYSVSDGHGRNSHMCLWNHPGNDITGVCVGVCMCVGAGVM